MKRIGAPAGANASKAVHINIYININQRDSIIVHMRKVSSMYVTYLEKRPATPHVFE